MDQQFTIDRENNITYMIITSSISSSSSSSDRSLLNTGLVLYCIMLMEGNTISRYV